MPRIPINTTCNGCGNISTDSDLKVKILQSKVVFKNLSDLENVSLDQASGDAYIYVDNNGTPAKLKVKDISTAVAFVPGDGIEINLEDKTISVKIGNGLEIDDEGNIIIDSAVIQELIDASAVWEAGEGEKSAQLKGTLCEATGDGSVAFGLNTHAGATASHAEGALTATRNDYDEETETGFDAAYSHVEGLNNGVNNVAEHGEGKFGWSYYAENHDPAKCSIHFVGVGTNEQEEYRKDAEVIMVNGDKYILGVGNYDGKDIENASTVQEVIENIHSDIATLQTDIDNVEVAVNDEVTRAEGQETAIRNEFTAADTTLGNRIAVFEANGTHDVAALEGRVGTAESEIDALQAKDVELAENIAGVTGDLADEVTRATDAESSLNNSITANTAAITKLNGADTVEGSVAYAVKGEANRAKDAENELDDKIDSAIEAADKAIEGVSNDLEIEIGRATAAETALSGRIESLEGRGRYLSGWNMSTGKPNDDPETELPYEYKSGDYYLVSNDNPDPETNKRYKPAGTSYTGDKSDVEETDIEVASGDEYVFDGNNWLAIKSATKTVTFSQIGGDPTDNSKLASALNNKQDTISDLSTIRSGAALGATALQEVPEGYATEEWVENQGYLKEHQSLADYRKAADQDAIDATLATKEELAAVEAQIPSIEGLASEDYVDNAVSTLDESLATVAKSGSYNDLIDTPTIPTVPTNISAFTNDVGYITEEDIPEIPTKTSDLINDSGFITATALEGYATETYVNTQVNAAAEAAQAYIDAGLATKQDTLTAGENITIEDNVISATGAKQFTDEEAEKLSGSILSNGLGYEIDNLVNFEKLYDKDKIAKHTCYLYGYLRVSNNIEDFTNGYFTYKGPYDDDPIRYDFNDPTIPSKKYETEDYIAYSDRNGLIRDKILILIIKHDNVTIKINNANLEFKKSGTYVNYEYDGSYTELSDTDFDYSGVYVLAPDNYPIYTRSTTVPEELPDNNAILVLTDAYYLLKVSDVAYTPEELVGCDILYRNYTEFDEVYKPVKVATITEDHIDDTREDNNTVEVDIEAGADLYINYIENNDDCGYNGGVEEIGTYFYYGFDAGNEIIPCRISKKISIVDTKFTPNAATIQDLKALKQEVKSELDRKVGQSYVDSSIPVEVKYSSDKAGAIIRWENLVLAGERRHITHFYLNTNVDLNCLPKSIAEESLLQISTGYYSYSAEFVYTSSFIYDNLCALYFNYNQDTTIPGVHQYILCNARPENITITNTSSQEFILEAGCWYSAYLNVCKDLNSITSLTKLTDIVDLCDGSFSYGTGTKVLLPTNVSGNTYRITDDNCNWFIGNVDIKTAEKYSCFLSLNNEFTDNSGIALYKASGEEFVQSNKVKFKTINNVSILGDGNIEISNTLPEKLQYIVNNLTQEKIELLVNFINDLTEVEEESEDNE